MVLHLEYDELSDYVQRHYGPRVAFSMVDEKTLKVSYKIVFPMSVSVKVKVVEVLKTRLTLGISCMGMSVGTIISNVLKFVGTMFPIIAFGISAGPDHTIIVDLSKIKQAKPVTDNLSLQSVSFAESHLSLTASLL